MLKTMLKIALVILLALTLAELGRQDPGYILINYQNTIIETSILVVIIALVGIALLVALIASLIRPVWNRVKPISANPRQEKIYTHLTHGMLSLADGDWIRAQKYLQKLPRNHQLNIIATLGEARASYELGQESLIESHLERAHTIDQKHGGKFRHHLYLAESQFAFARTDYPAALRALQKISASQQKDAFWKLKARILSKTNQWHQLYAILPKLRQDKLLDDQELLQLEIECFTAMLDQQPLETQNEFWKSIPAKRRQLSELAMVRYNALRSTGETKLALDIAQEQVHRAVDSRWALELAKLQETDWQMRYNLITKYFGHNTADVNVSKALGYIAQQGDQNKEALEHLRHALELQPRDLATQLVIFDLEKKQNQFKPAEQRLNIISEKISR